MSKYVFWAGLALVGILSVRPIQVKARQLLTEDEFVLSPFENVQFEQAGELAFSRVQTNSPTPISRPRSFTQDPFFETYAYLVSVKNPTFVGFLHAPLFLMVAMWYWFGRDYIYADREPDKPYPQRPQRLRPVFFHPNIPMSYYPPSGYTPGEIGTLIDEKAHAQDVVAEIAFLANLGYLEIKKLDSKPVDYLIKSKRPADEKLKPHQKVILNVLFNKAQAVSFAMFKQTSASTLDQMKHTLEAATVENGWFIESPRQSIYRFGTLGFLGIIVPMFIFGLIYIPIEEFVSVAVISLTGILYLSELIILGRAPRPANHLKYTLLLFSIAAVIGPLVFFYNFMITPLLTWIFVYVFLLQPLGIVILVGQMSQKTGLGSAVAFIAQGLSKTLKTGGWRYKHHATKAYIDEIIPYSIALGVSSQLASQLDELDFEIQPDQKYTQQAAEILFSRKSIFDLMRVV